MDWYTLARLEEARQAVGVAEISPEAVPLAGGWLCYGGPGSWQNQAVGIGLDGPAGDEVVEALVAFYDARGVEPEVLVCPFADVAYARALSGAGFLLADFENVLYRGLGADVDALDPGGPQGLVVREVREHDERDVATWVEVSTSGFRPLDEPLSAPLDEGSRRMLAHPRCFGLVAELDGVVVGGSALEVAGRIAALMATSVLPEARRQGVQRALMVERLRRARAAGAEVATIQSRPGIPTERNARRVGFEMAYTRAVLTRTGLPVS